MRLFLVGFMGAGKSTLSAALAKEFKHPHYDSDDILDSICKGKSAQLLTENKDLFRSQEERVVRQLIQIERGIISLGGGAIESSNTRALLHGKPVVFLDPGAAVCWQRVCGDNQVRPLAADYDSFSNLYDKRLPLYISVCRWRLTDNLPPQDLLGRLKTIICR